jgi:hypothetical protein
MEAAAFFDTLGTFGGCEFQEGHGVNIHSVWVSLILWGVGKGGGRSLSLF